jgi:hypothetical protein
MRKLYELFHLGVKELSAMKLQISDGIPQMEFYHKIYKLEVIGPCLKLLTTLQENTKGSVKKICLMDNKLKEDTQALKELKDEESKKIENMKISVDDRKPSWDDGESPWN